MERAKRLELIARSALTSDDQVFANHGAHVDTPLSTPTDLTEIAAAWKSLGPEIQDAVLLLVRAGVANRI
jgi:hypothetical protein